MKYEDFVELDNTTLQDCNSKYTTKNLAVILNDGHVIGFVKEGDWYTRY